MTDEFSRFHPLVNIVFYIMVLGITMFQMQMGLVIISCVCSVTYCVYLKREKSIKFCVMAFSVFIFSCIINPLFSHKGATLLFYLFTGNPVTLESIVYGIFASLIIVAMLFWFSTFNVVMSEDKILALIGKVMPGVALLLTMIFRFVPKFTRQSREIAMTQKALHGKPNKWINKMRNGAYNFSITITWALENSVETADSMTARGYGVTKRTSYNHYKIEKRDVVVILWMAVLFVILCGALFRGEINTFYYPYIRVKGNIIVYIIYFTLCVMPIIINIKEDIKWHRLKSKI
ncbi:energy-coupling factor transporter transmembrane component T [uncultured Eubacterium sp.]|uniref:energy-coupling factor transporter transmembrane component T n=1 Tax=uncultured Eubacterium sp. TaxID=165185 RepID=UPI0026738539|nr:energy-coupling factor transporter transmembrane component T [uncultured Eubacterium sp.]